MMQQGQSVSWKAREGKKTSSLLARMKKKKKMMTWTRGGVNSERSSYLAVVVGVGGGPSDVHPVAPGVVELRQPHEAEHLRERERACQRRRRRRHFYTTE